MYVCLCKAITERQLESAIKEGLCTRKQLFECLGVGGDCGKCNKEVFQMLNCSVAAKLRRSSNDAESISVDQEKNI